MITTQKLTPRQIVVASKHMRMGAMEMRQRLTLGKDVYVKAYLQDTLLAINELEKEDMIINISCWTGNVRRNGPAKTRERAECVAL